jgi:hypothetical protein
VTRLKFRLDNRLPSPLAIGRRWAADLRGATLVQFTVVLPVFVLVSIGLWALFTVYSAQQTLCEAVWQASRYLQVEGPEFEPEVYPYPDAWETIAAEIIQTELYSNAMTKIELDGVEITPPQQRRQEKEMDEVTWENVTQDWFFVHATATISNPLAVFVEGAADGNRLLLQCKGTGFFESPPIGPTPGGGSGGSRPPNCPPKPPICTPGPEPTFCAGCTPTPVPTCPPCRPR